MFKKLLALPFIVLALLLFSYSVASAWHATVTGEQKCYLGQRSITWHVTNSENTAGSFTYVVTGPNIVPAGNGALKPNKGTTDFSTNVTSTGTFTITVTPSWPNNNEHPKAYASVIVSGTCVPPTTTTRATTTTTTTSTTTRPSTTTTTTSTTRPETTTTSTTTTLPTTTTSTTRPPTTTVQVTTTTLPSSTTTVPSPSTTEPAPPSSLISTVHEKLAYTGSNTSPLVLLGLILFAVGLILVVVKGNHEEPLR